VPGVFGPLREPRKRRGSSLPKTAEDFVERSAGSYPAAPLDLFPAQR
jgi:hypothetical protein